MGAAAYRRGSRCISAQIDRERPDWRQVRFQDLADFSARHGRLVPFEPGVIRFGPLPGEVSLMNRQDRGWGESCYTYRGLWRLARVWRVVIVGEGADQHGKFLRFMPLPAELP